MIINDVPTYFTNNHAVSMTLRDYLAAKAMQGLVANNNTNPFEISKAAYVVADAMLKAREA
jgi:hypothetical protein